MYLSGLLEVLRSTDAYGALLTHLREAQPAWNVVRSARPYVVAALARDVKVPVIVVTARGKRAYNLAEQLPVWLGGDERVYRFPEPTPMFYDRLPWDNVVIRARLETLAALLAAEQKGQPPVVVTSARALMQPTMPVNHFRKATLTLRPGERHLPNALLAHWVKLGYEPVSLVTEPGTFSRRGGLLDIYPIAAPYPVRVDFFDDEIESLRPFDPTTQRTTGRLDALNIVPAREIQPQHGVALAKHLAAWFDGLHATDSADLTTPLNDRDALSEGRAFPYLEHYQPYIYPDPVTLLDYAPTDALIVVDDGDEVRDVVHEISEEAEINRENNASTGQLPPDYPRPYLDWPTLEERLHERPQLHLNHTGTHPFDTETHTFNAEAATQEAARLFSPGGRFGGQLRPFLRDVRALRQQGERVVVVTQQAKRLTELWQEQDSDAHVPTVTHLDALPPAGALTLVEGTLSAGWLLRGEREALHVITDAEIFGWSRPEPRRRKASSARRRRSPEADYADWQPGDYVVHVDYGIGRFVGLDSRTLEGTEREYLVVEYDGTDTLYVPIHQADRLTRYVGVDDKPPTMHKLGKAEVWQRVRRKAQRNAEEEAQELIALYARRAHANGRAYSPDNEWQIELEASFPYVETEDQLRVLREVKADMESGMTMDRLICGDVGYGKTEVALRAAFKAVVDQQQVAVLVPTTVLAQQHYETFTRRLEAFPVKVESISRFRTKAEQNRILAQALRGEIDILIGTHRLLSEDVTLPNLGLIIIDEEQRFGVKHKEHFKKLRAEVDVLTLTATPIPRTMYMAMSGVRDISMIQTPPEDRLPVITHVGAFDERLMRQAILREMDRGGQVFVVHNRVRTIEALQARLTQVVPEARSIVAHGQMSPRQLSQVMSTFANGDTDVLIATAIIENGIDMPNVNTLIVDRADTFGMSQLYQLRGRVGRGAQQAYAYFFYMGSNTLTEEARARLETLAEHTDLGSGFQIAVRDLELRGAGDILSTRQSGQVANVGLHLYTQLLQQAITEQSGQTSKGPAPAAARERIVIDLPLPAYLPEDWIPEIALRLQIYRRIGGLQTAEDVAAMRDELRDRFGEMPPAVEGLLYQMEVKLLAQTLSATAVLARNKVIQVKLPYLAELNRSALALALGDDIQVTRTAVEIDAQREDWQARLLSVLQTLKAGQPEAEKTEEMSGL